jgi:hypothetical protein
MVKTLVFILCLAANASLYWTVSPYVTEAQPHTAATKMTTASAPLSRYFAGEENRQIAKKTYCSIFGHNLTSSIEVTTFPFLTV